MQRRTFTKLLGASAATAALGRFGLARADEPFKAGFVYVGPVADFGWSHQHDLGRQAAQKAIGDKLKTTFVESVKEGPDSERVIRELATGGNGIIFTTSFGFMNPTIKVAKQFPAVKFEHCTGYKRAVNVATYNIRFYEGRYIQGVIAGKVSKSGVVGYIGSVPIPEVVMGMNAFIQGMHTVNPQGKIKLVWINGWYDPGKESDAAKALIDQGADIIAQHTDSAAPLQVAEQRGVHGFGQASDMIKFAPKAQLTSSVDHWDEYYTQRIQAAMDGSWTTQDIWGGLKMGMLHMAPWTNMPDDVAQAAQAAEDGIKSGSIVIFKGPINDQSGKIKVADGAQLTDDDILGMNWLAEGIEGTLPQ
ncbi:MAG TPA: BMP family ABC transporter substrate-binding protein [Verrucomicrobiae bacterium]|jgi:basic membrane protein A and related proteins|nr:BMP family ABC transporter substrate-binding protein [Verrucomicrobiae bacterium]